MFGALGIGIGHCKYIKYWQRAEFLEDYSHHYIQLFHIDHCLTGILIATFPVASPPPKASAEQVLPPLRQLTISSPAYPQCMLFDWEGFRCEPSKRHQYIKLSDQLDLVWVGVQFRATFRQTRKANDPIKCAKHSQFFEIWKLYATYPAPKLCQHMFKCTSLKFRVQDISTINNHIRSWMFQDCLQKPSDWIFSDLPRMVDLNYSMWVSDLWRV